MGLSQSIVVVNEFSVRGSGGVGSRGSTPGLYVERYIIDDEKNEALWPITTDTVDDARLRYEAHADAVMAAPTYDVAKKRAFSGRDGVAFTREALSVPFSEARRVAREIQSAFDSGKTVLKTVVTFDDDYLKDMGVLDDGPDYSLRGAHRGHVDQLRLRRALTEGLSRVSAGFDDLVWLASLHLDRTHVHFHVAAVDMGEGRLRYDGQQRGVLSARDKARLRRGVDDELKFSRELRPFMRTPVAERTRSANTVRRYVHDAVNRLGVPQMIMAALPEDESLWDVRSTHPSMRRANELVRGYVAQVVSDPSSGFDGALADMRAYVAARAHELGLSRDEEARELLRGRRVLSDACANSVYATLAGVPHELRHVETPVIGAVASGLPAAAYDADDRLSSLAARASSYAVRLSHHAHERRRFHDEEGRYLATAGKTEASFAAYDFYSFERLYQEQLMAKYQHLMGFFPADDEWRGRVRSTLDKRVRSERLAHLVADGHVRSLPADMAERYGLERYGIRGASALTSDTHAFDKALAKARGDAEVAEASLAFDVAEAGFVPVWNRRGDRLSLALRHDVLHPFDEVKALDLHRVGDDFAGGVDVSAVNVRVFVSCASERKELLDEALDYFRATGQGDVAEQVLPVADVEQMWECAVRLASGDTHVASSVSSSSGGHERPVRTVEISEGLDVGVRESIHRTIATNVGLEQVVRDLEL